MQGVQAFYRWICVGPKRCRGLGSITMSATTQAEDDEENSFDTEEPEMTATAAKQVSFLEALASGAGVEEDILYFEDEEQAKWVAAEDVILVTGDTFESGRREIWMHEALLHLVSEVTEHNTAYQGNMEELSPVYHELVADIGRNSITQVLGERGFAPDRYTE